MSAIDPANTTVEDLCAAALEDAGIVGIGQTPNSMDITGAQTRLQWMLQEWERKRWLVYHLVNLAKVCTGAISYTIGPGGDIDTGVSSVRPARIESAFLRQLVNSPPNQVDYFLEILQSREDYDKIALKSLQSFPGTIFLDSSWPLGNIFAWPVPQANIYELHVSIMAQLPASFVNQSVKFSIPYEYYNAIHYNLAVRLRSWKQIGSFQGDPLPGLAKTSLATLRGANTQIARLMLPDMNRTFIYNIFSDRFY